MAARERLGRAILLLVRGFCICGREMAMGVYTRGLVMTVWTALHIDCGSQAAVPFWPILFLELGAYRRWPIKRTSIR